MAEHLPECLRSDPKFGPVRTICICDRLRQAEQRVVRNREGNGELWLDGYGTGFHDALEMARDAVAACPRAGVSVYRGGLIEADSALAAIDALLDKPSDAS